MQIYNNKTSFEIAWLKNSEQAVISRSIAIFDHKREKHVS